MSIYENLSEFAGKRVHDWSPDTPITNPASTAIRLSISYDEHEEGTTLESKLAHFLADPAAPKIESLVIGAWGDVAAGNSSAPVVEALAAARDRLQSLRHLFFGDITAEESEISWINQSDLSTLFEAYPALTHLTIRGGTALSLGTPRHPSLQELIIQSGGLPRTVIHEVAAADLPNLRHLELWLGEDNYGGDATPEDLAALLTGDRWPHLQYLGLKNSEIQDDIAAVVALAPVTARLETLDLSLGTLGDDGAKALLNSPAIRRLKKLDIHHHYVSPDLVTALQNLGITLDASDKQEPDHWDGQEQRYISVSE